MESFPKPYVGRLAPAPTGALHPGNARTFVLAWLRARRAGGRLLLRLEDLDHPKVKAGTALEAYRDLDWLGLDWDVGPAESLSLHDDTSVDDDPYVQSRRTAIYNDMLDALRKRELLYPCVCTRKELDALHSAPNAGEDLLERRYPGLCRDRFASPEEAAAVMGGRDVAWRFRTSADAAYPFEDGFHGWREGRLWEWSGDFLVARGERAGYQLAVVADDHLMGVTEVVRGDDLLASTERQLALYDAMGWSPPAFYHVPLVVGEDGRRLAKRHGDTRLSLLRNRGAGPERLLGWLARSCGWADELRETSLAEIAEKCDFSLLPRRAAVLTRRDKQWVGFE